MALGKLPVQGGAIWPSVLMCRKTQTTPAPGCPAYLEGSRTRACCACSRWGGGCLDIFTLIYPFSLLSGMVRWCWINFQCRGVLLIWIRVGQVFTALAVGAGGGCLFGHFFSPLVGRRVVRW